MSRLGLVTGASSGIGKELAKCHAKNGGDLILLARQEDKLIRLKKELEKDFKIQAYILPLDLLKAQPSTSIDEFLRQNNLSVEYFFNNAGFGGVGKFHNRDALEDQRMIQLNISVATELLHYFIPKMLEQKKGKILNVASSAGLLPGGPNQAVYCATKAYFLSLSKALHQEYKKDGLIITALCPGPVETGFAKAANAEKTELFKSNKLAQPQTVAQQGYEALEKGRVMILNALPTSQKMLLRLMPLVPDTYALSEIEKMQASEK